MNNKYLIKTNQIN